VRVILTWTFSDSYSQLAPAEYAPFAPKSRPLGRVARAAMAQTWPTQVENGSHRLGTRSGYGREMPRPGDSLASLRIVHASKLATIFIATAKITAPKRYDSKAWESAIRRMALVVKSVSET
jgi:hypothetical protein